MVTKTDDYARAPMTRARSPKQNKAYLATLFPEAPAAKPNGNGEGESETIAEANANGE